MSIDTEVLPTVEGLESGGNLNEGERPQIIDFESFLQAKAGKHSQNSGEIKASEVFNKSTSLQEALSKVVATVSEIAEHQDAIRQRGEELIREFGIAPELFYDDTHTLFFSTIALRYADLEGHKPGMTVDKAAAEMEFIKDAIVLLAGRSSSHFEDMHDQIDAEDIHNPAYLKRIYDHFTNVQVSQELNSAIDEGLLDEVKARLGITSDNEDPFEVRVLNIGNSSTFNGLEPPVLQSVSDRPRYEEWLQDSRAYNEYSSGLEARGTEFKRLLDMEEIVGPWVTEIDGVVTINLPLPFVEKILYRDQVRSSYYTDDDWERDFAAFEHEYTHTQGGLNLDRNVFYGIALEERRAEHFAKNKNGYQDVRAFFFDFQAVTGISITEYMDGLAKGGKQDDVYTMLADRIGLQNMLEFALTVPRHYVSDERLLQRSVNSYLGGQEGLIKRMYMQVLKDPQKADEMNARLDRLARGFLVHGNIESWANYRNNILNNRFLTEIIEERVSNLRAKQAS